MGGIILNMELLAAPFFDVGFICTRFSVPSILFQLI
jgi:hypothetical protein